LNVIHRFITAILALAALCCLVMVLGLHYGEPWARWFAAQPAGTFIGVLGALAVVFTVFQSLVSGPVRKPLALIIVFSLLYFELVDSLF
jgi:hypothetical protein